MGARLGVGGRTRRCEYGDIDILATEGPGDPDLADEIKSNASSSMLSYWGFFLLSIPIMVFGPAISQPRAPRLRVHTAAFQHPIPSSLHGAILMIHVSPMRISLNQASVSVLFQPSKRL